MTQPQIYGTTEHPYSTLPETKEDLPWADLISLDLSVFDQPGGKQALADKLKWAVHNVGFFYVTDFGIPQDAVDEQFAIGKEVFDLPFEERAKYAADHANGGYNGYTGADLPHFVDNKIERRRNVEVFNLPKFEPRFDAWHAAHKPAPIEQKWDQIVDFGRKIHANVIERLLVVFAIVLELEDEQYFVKRHLYDNPSEDHLRYMKYAARTDEENKEAQGLYGGGHTDLGSITLLFRQPVAALQVRRDDGKWFWVRPHPGSITVNICDTLQILSGDYLKSSVHRVSVPPADQAGFDRLGVLYFVRPNNDVPVEVVQDSPLLEREGIYEKLAQEPPRPKLTVAQWVKAKQADIFSKEASARYDKLITQRRTGDLEGQERLDLQTVVAGVPVKYYA